MGSSIPGSLECSSGILAVAVGRSWFGPFLSSVASQLEMRVTHFYMKLEWFDNRQRETWCRHTLAMFV